MNKCAFLAILFIFGGPGGPLHQTQGYQSIRAVRSHYRADKFITREKNHQFFIYGPQCEKCTFLGYSGGGGGLGGP